MPWSPPGGGRRVRMQGKRKRKRVKAERNGAKKEVGKLEAM